MPDYGDTIWYKTDRKPDIDVGIEGKNQSWNFTNLNSPYTDMYTFDYPNLEDHHHDVDLIVNENGHMLYLLEWSKNDLGIVSQYDKNDAFGQYQTHSHFDNSGLLRKERMAYEDKFQDSYIETKSYNTKDLPLDLLNLFNDIPDSLRTITSTKVDYHVDAYGTMFLPQTKHEVIRVRADVETKVSTAIFAQGNWSEVTRKYLQTNSSIPEANTRSIEYHYYSSEGKLPVASIYAEDNGRVRMAKFQLSKSFAKGSKPFNENTGLFVQPNPSFGDVRFDFYGYPAGKYNIKVYNTIFKEIWAQDVTIGKNDVVDADLRFLRKGTYFYAINDVNGERLITKKLIIIKP